MATSTEDRDGDPARSMNEKTPEIILEKLKEIQQAQEEQVRKSKWDRVPAIFSAAIQGIRFLFEVLRSWFQ